MHNKQFLLRTITLFSLLNFLILFNIFSQDVSTDVVYLKNGSIIKGSILEIVPGGNITIKTADGKLLIFAMDKVEKTTKEISKEKPKPSKPEVAKANTEEVKSTPTFHSKGLFVMMKLGLSKAEILSSQMGMAMGGIAGYQFNDYFSAGLGVEVNKFSESSTYHDVTLVPIYLDARFYVSKRRVQPMFYLQLGGITGKHNGPTFSSYEFIPDPSKGGLFMGMGAGFKFYGTKNFAFLTSGGLTRHSVRGYSKEPKFDSATNTYVFETTNQSNTLIAGKMDMCLIYYFGR